MSGSEDGQLRSPAEGQLISGEDDHETDSLDIKPPQMTASQKRKDRSNRDGKHSKERKHKERDSSRDKIREQEYLHASSAKRFDPERSERKREEPKRDERTDMERYHRYERDDSKEMMLINDRRYQKVYDRSIEGGGASTTVGRNSANSHGYHHHHAQQQQYHHHHQQQQLHLRQRQDYYERTQSYHHHNDNGLEEAVEYHSNRHQQQYSKHAGGLMDYEHHEINIDLPRIRRKYAYEHVKDAEILEQDLRSRLLSKRDKYVKESETEECKIRIERRGSDKVIASVYEDREIITSKVERHKNRDKDKNNVIEVLDSPDVEMEPTHQKRKHKKRNKEKERIEKRVTPDDPELLARRAKILAAEREKEKRKDAAREELEARREMRKERKEVFDILSPTAVAASVTAGLNIVKRKRSHAHEKRKRLKQSNDESDNENDAEKDYSESEYESSEYEDEHENADGMDVDNDEEEEEDADDNNDDNGDDVDDDDEDDEDDDADADADDSDDKNESSIKSHSKSKRISLPEKKDIPNDELRLSDLSHLIGEYPKSVKSKKMKKKRHSKHRSNRKKPTNDDDYNGDKSFRSIHSQTGSHSRSRSESRSRSQSRSRHSHTSRSYDQSESPSPHSSRSFTHSEDSHSSHSFEHSNSHTHSSRRSEEIDMKINQLTTRESDETILSKDIEIEKLKFQNDASKSPTVHTEGGVQLPNYYPGIQGCRSVEEFQCLNRIEEGTYGVVYRAKDKRTSEIVALKRLKMEKEKEGFPITSLREINTLLKGQHPNIVTVREIVVGSNMDKIFIVMDYVEHDLKSLMETMKKRKQSFMPGEVKCLTQQLLRAVGHLHDNWILHRDLKTSNLLLSHKGILKVGDFGLAREYGSPLNRYTLRVVTLWYRAPELLLCSPEYSTPIDIWSVGCIFAEFLQMSPLFPGESEMDQLNRIFKELGTPNEKLWPGYNELPAVKNIVSQNSQFADYPMSNMHRKRFQTTDVGISLLNGLLTYDPKKRLNAEAALAHPYFKELPLPIDPSMFPTWPAKSELGVRKVMSPKPPSGGSQFKQLADDGAVVSSNANKMSGIITGNKKSANASTGGFVLNAGYNRRQLAMGPGFNLKF